MQLRLENTREKNPRNPVNRLGQTRTHRFGKIPINFHSMTIVTKQRLAFCQRYIKVYPDTLDENLMRQISGKRDKNPDSEASRQRGPASKSGKRRRWPDFEVENASRESRQGNFQENPDGLGRHNRRCEQRAAANEKLITKDFRMSR